MSPRRALHWFRNDLRLRDNAALRIAATADALGLVYVLDPVLLASPRMGAPRVHFLVDGLAALAADLERKGQRLHVCRGLPEQVIPRLAAEHGVDQVTWSEDTAPYARSRDARVQRLLEAKGVRVETALDRVLVRSGDLTSQAGHPYTTFTPFRNAFWKRWERRESRLAPIPRLPTALPRLGASAAPAGSELGFALDGVELPAAGETAAWRRLRTFVSGALRDYPEQRDRMDLDGTSRLSPYLRFGMLSPRQCLQTVREAARDDPRLDPGARRWCDELIWREFYATILEAHPRVLRGNFRRELVDLGWQPDERAFAAWCAGRTGFPIVDAGLRQLRATGWMHNRARMIVASFLTKDLWIDWRWGERHFEHWLVDADPASNNGGWQWSASTGTDAQPYFRIFNPLAQAKRFDPRGDYVRRWIPELRAIGGSAVHEPARSGRPPGGYPGPMVDHAERRRLALARFEAARGAR